MQPTGLRTHRPRHLGTFCASLAVTVSAATALAQAPGAWPAADAARPAPEAAEPPPRLRVLTGDEARQVEALAKTIDKLEREGRYAEAVVPAREVLAIRRRVQGEGHWEAISARFVEQKETRMAGQPAVERGALGATIAQYEEASKLYVQGRYADCEKVLRTIVDVSRRNLGEDHPDTATCDESLAACLIGRGRTAEAEPILRQALAIRLRTVGEGHPETAFTCNNLGVALDARARYDESEPMHRRALAIRREALGEDHPDTATSYHNLGASLESRGRYAEAEVFLRKALDIRRRVLGEGHAETAFTFHTLAHTIKGLGKYAEAEPLYRKALAIDLAALGDNHPDTALCYGSLGYNLDAQGRYAEAEPLHRKSLAIMRRTLGEDHPRTSEVWTELAMNLREQRRSAEAEPMLRNALKIIRDRMGETHPLTALGHGRLGLNLHAQRKYVEAEASFRKALDISRGAPEDRPDAITTRYHLAMTLVARGELAEAESLLWKAMAIGRRILDDGHPYMDATFRLLIQTLIARGKYDRAKAAAIEGVRGYESARLRVGVRGLDRIEFGSSASPPLLLAALLARRGEGRDAWQYWESSLARGLFDDLTARRSRPLTADERRRQDDLVGQLGRVDNQIGALAGKSVLTDEQRGRLDGLKARRLDLQARQAQFEEELIRKYQVVAGAVYSLDQVQARLPADAALVGWLDLTTPGAEDPRGDHWACVVRSRGTPRWVRIPGTGAGQAWTEEDERRPGRVRQLLVGDARADWRAATAALAAQRLDPLGPELSARDGLPAVGHLIVLPSRSLSGIPVEAMIAAREVPSGPDRVSYAPSGTIFAWLESRPREGTDDPSRSRRLLALADPVPAPDLEAGPGAPDPGASAGPVVRGSDADRILRSRGAAFTRLPGSAREVQAIAGLFGQAEVHLGSDASEQTLETLRSRDRLAGFAVIHLAAHGQVDDLAPMNSRLLLSQDRLPDPMAPGSLDGPAYDGILTAGEVLSTWKLDAELVTLSACESGLGRPSSGEGHVGFAQAFFLAGARSLVVSLWAVDDRATSLLMTRFYQNWLGKRPGLDRPLSKADALREARTWLSHLSGPEVDRELESVARGGLTSRSRRPAADHPFAHPHDWAGFILMGDPD
jgi:CHAT domain-containing protein/tetratricopeptide (TPR) repeat protein